MTGAPATHPSAPGRACPLDYRYAPATLAGLAETDVDALWVVGGLYGNAQSLERVLSLFDRDPLARRRLVFNGDFHWFDAARATFAAIENGVHGHDVTRGNVETEIAAGGEGGCGCGYPEWVDDAIVSRSNAILARLAGTARSLGSGARLAALPMARRYRVGDAAVAVVHGDAVSLAGWGFARETASDAGTRARWAAWADAAAADVFACTHTCTPMLAPIDATRWVANNGAAGMPNCADGRYGLATRIATAPWAGDERVAGVRASEGLFIDAIALRYDEARFAARFLADWPPGSPAYASYWSRIRDGTSLRAAELLLPASQATDRW